MVCQTKIVDLVSLTRLPLLLCLGLDTEQLSRAGRKSPQTVKPEVVPSQLPEGGVVWFIYSGVESCMFQQQGSKLSGC